MMLSYRGYGKSEGGRASEAGLQRDAQCALDYVLKRKHSESKVVLYGQSLGGAVAIDLAYRRGEDVWALVIENTFLSIPRLIPDVMPRWMGYLGWLCNQPWRSEDKIGQIKRTVNLLLIAGGKDELIPIYHMQGLWKKIARSEEEEEENWQSSISKNTRVKDQQHRLLQFSILGPGTHNDTCALSEYYDCIRDFLTPVQ